MGFNGWYNYCEGKMHMEWWKKGALTSPWSYLLALLYFKVVKHSFKAMIKKSSKMVFLKLGCDTHFKYYKPLMTTHYMIPLINQVMHLRGWIPLFFILVHDGENDVVVWGIKHNRFHFKNITSLNQHAITFIISLSLCCMDRLCNVLCNVWRNRFFFI